MNFTSVDERRALAEAQEALEYWAAQGVTFSACGVMVRVYAGAPLNEADWEALKGSIRFHRRALLKVLREHERDAVCQSLSHHYGTLAFGEPRFLRRSRRP